MNFTLFIDASSAVRAGTDDTEAYANTNNDEKDRGLDLNYLGACKRNKPIRAKLLTKLKKY